uniref:Protection of telomeres protein 1 n=1 Tax=Lepisosteus oculatus TaxID=7918 RepID=W5NFW0_LEPOC
MSVHILTGDAQIPSTLQRIYIKDLNHDSQCTDKYVKGTVIMKHNLIALTRGEDMLKAVIEEHAHQHAKLSETTSINVFSFGKLAKDFSDKINQGDTIVITGFRLGMSPTVNKDKRHLCQIELEERRATIYVCPAAFSGQSSSVDSSGTSEHSSNNPKPKYTYVPLNELKPGEVANVYGIVTFFKQPFQTKGTDYCLVLTITDESGVKLGCSIFNEKLEALPQIYKIGDIVRFHRIKSLLFNSKLSGMTSLGFSALTFDGRVGTPVCPRTSSKTYHFGEEDRRIVEKLRQWAATIYPNLEISLATVQPKSFFDLTCQLLAKAEISRACVLLKVWDGTKCPHRLLKILVEPSAIEGNMAAIQDLQDLIVEILVYDNHVEVAKKLKPGMYLRIYNLHAKLQASGTKEQTSNECHLGFHLHGGTSYGRGIKVLPEDSSDVQELKKALESANPEDTMDDLTLLNACCTSAIENSLNAELSPYQEDPLTVLTCHHTVKSDLLSNVKNSTPPQKFHIKAKLKSYQPDKLYQSVKLYCPKCKRVQEIPDDETIGSLFQEALNLPVLSSDSWYETFLWESSTDVGRKVAVHFVNVLGSEEHLLTLVQGATLEEVCRLSTKFESIIPIKFSEDQMTLLDLSAPFLIQGKKWSYGCKHCSCVKNIGLYLEQEMVWEPENTAEVLGVELLQYVFLMKFELDDGTASLDAILWEDAEKFFQMLPVEVMVNRAMQEKMQMTMATLCPPGKHFDELPWLEFCIGTYTTDENEDRSVYYQIFDTMVAEKL